MPDGVSCPALPPSLPPSRRWLLSTLSSTLSLDTSRLLGALVFLSPATSGPALSIQLDSGRILDCLGEGLTPFLSCSFMNRRGISANPYLGSTANGYAHPSGTALHYDDVPCINGSVSASSWQ